jgi:hypothetical protein
VIERIYIPTIRRCDTQITFESLPEKLQQRVIMVIEPSERHLYNYKCDYLELPNTMVGTWTQLAQTRKFIHQHAGKIKYAMIDDDLVVYKRNAKYFNGVSDMEKSKRKAKPEEIINLFDTASFWLDNPDIGVIGISEPHTPPRPKVYSDTTGAFSFIFIDGKKISEFVNEIDTNIRVAEDLLFIFLCLSKGVNTRIMNDFLFINKSFSKELKGKRPLWEEISNDTTNHFQSSEHYNILQYIKEKFPNSLTIYQENGIMKNIKHFKKIYNKKEDMNSLTRWIEE